MHLRNQKWSTIWQRGNDKHTGSCNENLTSLGMHFHHFGDCKNASHSAGVQQILKSTHCHI